MTRNTNCKLTKCNLVHILNQMSMRYKEKTNVYHIPSYAEKILSLNKLFCRKCDKIIDIGDIFSRIPSCRSSKAKYYHNTCFDSLFQ